MVKIYFAGHMKGRTLDDCMEWQIDLMNEIKNYWTEFYGYVHANMVFDFYCPPMYYNYESKNHYTEREIKDFEMMLLNKMDIVIVNLDRVNESVGTHYELAKAEFLKKDRPIFVIGYGKVDGVHPWILDSISRIESDSKKLAAYICDYFV